MSGRWSVWAIVSLLVLGPSFAHAQTSDTTGGSWDGAFGWVAVAVAILNAIAMMIFVARWRRETVKADRLRAALDRAGMIASTATFQTIVWDDVSGGEQVSGGLARLIGNDGGAIPSYQRLRDCFDQDAAGSLDAAVGRLRGQGNGFDLRLTPKDSDNPIHLIGQKLTAPRLSVLWVARDGGAAAPSDPSRVSELGPLLDALPIPVWTRSKTLEIDFANKAYVNAVEAGSIDPDAPPPELAARVISNNGRALGERAKETGEAQSERHHIVIGGERRLIEIYEAPLDDSGATAGFAIDHTEIEQVQSELSRHVAGHEGVLHNMGTAIAIYGANQRLIFFNNAFTRLWRMEESWLQTEPTLSEVLERFRDNRLLPEFADFPLFKGEQLKLFTSLLEPIEDLVHLPNGTALRSVVAPHALGGLLFTWEDVTDALAMERSYNTLIAVQRETLDHLYEGVAVIGGDGRLKLSNPTFGTMWHLPQGELAGEMHISTLVDNMRSLLDEGGDWETEKQHIIGLLTDREPQSGRIERTDGTVLDFATVPLPDGAVLLSYQDVTDSNRVERALLERNEALETADRLKSEFIASVSYELRTPLNTIIGFAEILNGKYFGDLNDRQAEYSDGILDSSHRLLSLINNILDLATIEAGHMSLELDTVELKEMLSDVMSLLSERVRRKRLETVLEYGDDIGAIVADERRLKQALFNILSNAVKFTPDNGQISISAERDDDGVWLTCTDTGIGIDAADHGRVFGKFERGSSVEARRSGGAGLGLSLVKSLVELHGGRVDLESEPGVGTTVKCWLPSRGAVEVLATSDDRGNLDRLAGAG